MIDGDPGGAVAEAKGKTWTYEAIVAEGLDPKHYELVAGALVEKQPVSLGGGCVWGALTALLTQHVRAEGLGIVPINGRFLVRADPRIERRPDIAFVLRARVPDHPYPELFPGAPDLAVEILSPTDPASSAARKAREYVENGASEVWNVDPDAQTITVYRQGIPARPYGCGDTLESPDLLPGFGLDLSELFEGV